MAAKEGCLGCGGSGGQSGRAAIRSERSFAADRSARLGRAARGYANGVLVPGSTDRLNQGVIGSLGRDIGVTENSGLRTIDALPGGLNDLMDPGTDCVFYAKLAMFDRLGIHPSDSDQARWKDALDHATQPIDQVQVIGEWQRQYWPRATVYTIPARLGDFTPGVGDAVQRFSSAGRYSFANCCKFFPAGSVVAFRKFIDGKPKSHMAFVKRCRKRCVSSLNGRLIMVDCCVLDVEDPQQRLEGGEPQLYTLTLEGSADRGGISATSSGGQLPGNVVIHTVDRPPA